MRLKPNPIGADVTYHYADQQGILHGYISFGRYSEKAGTDSHGVNDEDILYYADDEAELKTLSEEAGKRFVVLGYELVYGT